MGYRVEYLMQKVNDDIAMSHITDVFEPYISFSKLKMEINSFNGRHNGQLQMPSLSMMVI